VVVTWPNPLLKQGHEQGHLEQVVQDHIQLPFEYLPGWRLHNLSGQLVPLLGHPHGKNVIPEGVWFVLFFGFF